MTHSVQSLTDRVAALRNGSDALSPHVADALKLAEFFGHIKPEEFHIPSSDALISFRPLNVNRMLVRTSL